MQHLIVHLNRNLMRRDKSGAFHYSTLVAKPRKDGMPAKGRCKGVTHTQSLVLEGVLPVVNANRIAAIQSGNREVYAWLDGYASAVAPSDLHKLCLLTINPYLGENRFMAVKNGKRFALADAAYAGRYVLCDTEGVWLCRKVAA